MNDNLFVAIVATAAIAAICGAVIYTRNRSQATEHPDNPPVSRPPRGGHGAGAKKDDDAERLFMEYLKTFERDYLAYLLEEEVLNRDLPMATLRALAQQYGASKGDPHCTPNLDLPKKGVPSEKVTELMRAWLAKNDDSPTNDPPSFRVRRIIKERLMRQVTEICDKAAQTH